MERVVTLGNNALTLDFTGLFDSKPEKQAPEKPVEPLLAQGVYKSPTEPQKPPEAPETATAGEQAITLYRERKQAAEAHQKSLDVYKTYQENIKRSGQLQTDILKGIKAGESVYSLFLQAAKAISLMTNNSLFYSQIEADIVAIYGAGLLEKDPLQKDLQDTQTRLERLLEAEKREQAPDSQSRIQAAIKAHRARIAELENLIE
jgi:hypothetical protein